MNTDWIKLLKKSYRLCAGVLTCCLTINSLAVHASEETSSISDNCAVNISDIAEETVSDNISETQATITEEFVEKTLEESVEDDSASSEVIETAESSEEIETVIEEDVYENISEYKISGIVTDITNKSATFSFDLEGIKEGESIFVRMFYCSEGQIEDVVRTKVVNSDSGEFLLTDLYSDMDYIVWAVMYADDSYTEELAKTEKLDFHTLSNEIHYISDLTFTNVTDSSVTVNIVPSEEMLSIYRELDEFYIGVDIKYKIAGPQHEYISSSMLLFKSAGYAGTLTLDNLYAGTDYEIKVTWRALGNSGKELSNYNVTTSESRIQYNFSVEGDRIGEGTAHFEITSGYEDGEEFIVYVYWSDNNGNTRQTLTVETLNAENNYTCDSQFGVITEMGVEYRIWAELKQRNEDGLIKVNVVITDEVVKYVEKTKVFDFSLVEGSVTYCTAKLDVKWINTDVIGSDEIRVYVTTDNDSLISSGVTLKKGEKEQVVIECTALEPGKTYDCHVTMVINNRWVDFGGNVSFTTKEHTFEPIGEIKTPSQEDIARKWKELKFDYQLTESYERKVNHTDGGLLSKETLQNVVNYINLCRYTAGIPADVIYDEEYSSLCNATAELNRLNGGFNYKKPDGITDEFYERACLMAYISLAMPCPIFGSSIKLMDTLPTLMVADTGMGNRSKLLDPSLYVVGFGRSGTYARGYFENSFERIFDKGYVHWPAANAPVELTYTAYSFSLVPDFEFYSNDEMTLYLSEEYDNITSNTDITVQVVNQKNGKTWNLTRVEDILGAKNYVYMTSNHSMQFGLEDARFYKGDEVTVTVTGTTINGVDAPITYTMNFFSVEDIEVPDIMAESISIVSEDAEVMENMSIQLEAQIFPENATNKKVIWSVESEDGLGQAEITEDGLLTGKMEGNVRVTAKCESDTTITTSILIRVKEWNKPLRNICFAKDTLRLEQGDSYYLPAKLTPGDATVTEIVYTSDNPEKVTVDNGLIHALAVTQEPVTVKVMADDLYAECQVEVYANAEKLMDKNYDTRITDVYMSGDSTLYIGKTNQIRFYPVTNGQELLASEYEMIITCNEKYLTLTPTISEDNGCWYELTGMKAGKQKISITVKSKVEGNENPESVTKNFTYVVVERVSEEAEEISTVPVLVNNNISVNQNTVDGTALDIRLIEGNINITNVYLTSKKNDGTENLFSLTLKNGIYYVQTKEIGANKKYNLIVHIETEQGAWEYPLKVATKKSFPAVTIKQTVKPNTTLLYENAVLKVTGKEAIESVTFTTASPDFVQVGVEGNGAEYLLTIGQKEHGKKLNKKGIVEISFAGYRSIYSKKITVSTTSKKVKTNTLISNTPKVTVNNENGEEIAATLQMSLKNSAEKYPTRIIINSTNSKTAKMLSDESLYFTYNKNTGILKVFVKVGTAQGNYKYNITGYILENGAFVATEGRVPLTVAVAAKEPTVTLKASGNIDLIAREQSCVTYTPSIKNIAGCVKTAALEGADADKFYVRVEETGKIKVYARASAALFPKTTYTLNIKATLDNGYACNPVQVKIKPKQSVFKASAKQSTLTLCRSEVKAQPIEIVAKNPLSARIAHVKVVSIPQGMAYDSENQTLQITDSQKVKAGKTYKVTFEVTPAGAYKSIKPSRITIRVKVK